MSETYTIGGDTAGYFMNGQREGQTIIPLETHVLHYIDLNIRLSNLVYFPWILVYETDANHHPTGDFISQSRGMDYPYKYAWITKRVRFPMSAKTLYQGHEYAIVAVVFTDYPYYGHWCQYDKGDATYPRGMRITTEDGGASWQDHPNDDLIFCEFGDPPTPSEPPNPPVDNVALFNVEQEITKTGVKLIVTTSVPSHLFMLWTTKEPEKHTRPTLRRGVLWKDAIRFCFVEWNQNEQLEPSDTLYHTFIKEPWPHCETRWFTFRAMVNGEWSPSVGPIFKKHREAPEYWLILLEPWQVTYEPPDMTLVIYEPWTVTFNPPDFSLIIREEWTS